MKQLNQKGFTLIELLVVIGIIGILSVIAIPNFMKFQAKAKQSEAKVNLSGIYTAQKSFFSEFGQYHSDLATTGYQPEGAQRYYQVGFNTANTPAIPASAAPRVTQCAVLATGVLANSPNGNQSCPATLPAGNPFVGPAFGAGVVTDPTAGANPVFVAGAEGFISGDAGVVTDQWNINQNRFITNVRSGY